MLESRTEFCWYRSALLICGIFQFIHVVALPIMITYDGSLYIQYSEAFFAPNFLLNWDFLRTPLFPLLIKVFSTLFGDHPLTMIFLNTSLGFAGTWLLSAAVKREGYPKLAAGVFMLLSLYPIQITYQHTLLSDVGIYFCLAALINVTLSRPATLWRKTALLVAVITLSYYFRPNLLYLGPIMALLYLLQILRGSEAGNWWNLATRISRQALLHGALVALLPFILAQPWKLLARMKDPREIQNRMDEQLFFGLFNQLVIQPGDPLLDPQFSAEYQALIDRQLVNGHLPLDGVGGNIVDVVFPKQPYFAQHSSFLRQVCEHPLRYSKGVARTGLLFMGFQGHNWPENRPFMHCVLPLEAHAEATILMCPATLDATVRAHYSQKTGNSFIGNILLALNSLYDVLVIIASIVTLAGLAWSLWRADVRLFAFTGMWFAFIMMYVLALMAGERYAFPGFCVALMNLFLVPAWILNSMRARSSQKI